MEFITYLSSIISLIIPVSIASVLDEPTILVTRRVIEKDGWMPVSIFWHYPNLKKGDKLIVYNAEPPRILANVTITDYSGRYDLPSTIPDNDAGLEEFCVMITTKKGVYNKNLSCKSKVQWMFDRREDLQHFTLMDLVIPGTHQSAAYPEFDDQPLNEQSYISRWIDCQTRSIKSQLMDGIRYLDLRPSIRYADGGKKYILSHNRIALMTMDSAVEQINEFLDTSKDIVIVSFKEFYAGFNSDDDHLSFIHYLEDAFIKYAQPRRPWTFQLNGIWYDNRRLIITYNHRIYFRSTLMWPPIVQHWSDVMTIHDLYSHLDSVNKMHQNISRPWTAMAELTHSFTTIIQDVFLGNRSLRHWAERLSEKLPKWYIEEWNSTANIIAVDFYQTSGIVELAIHLNEGRADGTYRKPGKLCSMLSTIEMPCI